MHKLSDWSVVPLHRYAAPELGKCVAGTVSEGHRLFGQGQIRTSPIEKVTGRVVTTESGSRYELVGPPSEDYVQWLEDNGHDSSDPVPTFK